MPLQATSGAASYDAFGGGVAAVPQYIEDVFSTYLYTGNGSTQTINNGIDLAGEGGLVWLKSRTGAYNNYLIPTPNGSGWGYSNTTDAFVGVGGSTFTFNNNGWTTTATGVGVNALGENYASWTFRKQPKFFDVVTYTGTGSVQNIAHNLGSTPGCIIVKSLAYADYWVVYHRGANGGVNPEQYGFYLNDTSSQFSGSVIWNNTAPTSTQFTLGTYARNNTAGQTYVAYLFAHDAGGFGLTGTDNVISCGSYTGNGSATGPVIDLGYEPQFLIIKRASNAADWVMHDNMRGISETSYAQLRPNLSDAEYTGTPAQLSLTSTGFQIRTSGTNYNASGNTYIYIAIRRGPMKVPKDGTSVFSPVAYTGDGTDGRVISAGITADAGLFLQRTPTYPILRVYDRLRGKERALTTTGDLAEVTASLNGEGEFTQSGAIVSSAGNAAANLSGRGNVLEFFKRAPSFFDVVCYTGTGSALTLSHNLGVQPELIILKQRNAANSWPVATNFTATTNLQLILDSTTPIGTYAYNSGDWFASRPTASSFQLGGPVTGLNVSGNTYVAYLFATCAGVSKVFSYTGNGSSQTINCGFTAGARWVLIKRTDSTGDWYVWDSARGIVSGNDPHLSLNTSATEVTTDDTIDTDSTGFVVNQVSATNVNVSSATYIGIAIA